MAPPVPVAGLGHPYLGQDRPRVAPQRFVCRVVLIAPDDCMQAIRDAASTRLQPGEQQGGTLTEKVGGAPMLLSSRFLSHTVGIVFDPARVVAPETNGACCCQVAQGPHDASGTPVEVQ